MLHAEFEQIGRVEWFKFDSATLKQVVHRSRCSEETNTTDNEFKTLRPKILGDANKNGPLVLSGADLTKATRSDEAYKLCLRKEKAEFLRKTVQHHTEDNA